MTKIVMVYRIRGERESYPKAVPCGSIEGVKREDHCGSPQATAATDSSRQIPPSSTALSSALFVYFPFSWPHRTGLSPPYLLPIYLPLYINHFRTLWLSSRSLHCARKSIDLTTDRTAEPCKKPRLPFPFPFYPLSTPSTDRSLLRIGKWAGWSKHRARTMSCRRVPRSTLNIVRAESTQTTRTVLT